MIIRGLGIVTTPSRNFIYQGEEPTDVHFTKVISDEKYLGVAFMRNKLMEELYDAGCHYIAICDDDLIYHTPHWFKEVTWVMAQHGLRFVCLPEVMKGIRTDISPGIEKWNGYIGAFYILHRSVIEEVGYFSIKFKGYGFEDAHYKHRLHKHYGEVGIPSILPYLVSSQDVLGLNPTPSRTDKQEQIEINHPIYLSELQNGIIYYPRTIEQLGSV